MIRATVLAVSAGVLVLGGCARRHTEVEEANRSQTLLLGNGAEPEDLDPQVVTAYSDQNILLSLFEGLTAIDEATSQAVPAAAASWDSSADGLVWTFHLRDGLRWSNGEPLVAQDFVDSWRRALSPAIAAEYADLFYPIRGAEAYNLGRNPAADSVGVSAPDGRTVRIELARPTPYLPLLAALPPWYPINPRVLARFGAMTRKATAWTRPGNLVGNGPFVLEEWVPNARIRVGRNPDYWNASAVTLRHLVFFPTDSPDTEERDFRAGQIHVTYALPVSKIAVYRRDNPAVLRIDPFLQTFFLRFNVRKPPFDDPRVREALSLAIDRDALSKHVLFSGYPPAHSLTPANCGGYTPRARVDFDPARARSLLAEAGHPQGKGIASFEVQLRNDEVQPPAMEAIQEMWEKELGIHATLATLEQKTWLQNQETLNYTVSTSGWAGDFLDPVTFLDLFTGDSSKNWTGWADAAYDGLIAQAARQTDAGARFESFQKAEAILLQRGPIAPLYFGSRTYLILPNVKGWAPALLGYHRYAFVRLEE